MPAVRVIISQTRGIISNEHVAAALNLNIVLRFLSNRVFREVDGSIVFAEMLKRIFFQYASLFQDFQDLRIFPIFEIQLSRSLFNLQGIILNFYKNRRI